jgi:hypothetical protein
LGTSWHSSYAAHIAKGAGEENLAADVRILFNADALKSGLLPPDEAMSLFRSVFTRKEISGAAAGRLLWQFRRVRGER